MFGRARTASESSGLAAVSPADALWFMELPDKIRRKHFSREEQLVLAGCRDARDETVYRLGATRAGLDAYTRPQSQPRTASELDASITESFLMMNTSSLFYHDRDARPDPLASHPIPHRRKASHVRADSRVASANTVDHEAAYYQDPETRLKLRVYLASPQKFDEAVEFGFPADDARTLSLGIRNHSVSRLHSKRSHESTKTSKSLLMDELVADTHSECSSPDPQTPAEHDLPLAHREMTLRMTLTRPDLRADDAEIYGWQADDKLEIVHEHEQNLPDTQKKQQQQQEQQQQQQPQHEIDPLALADWLPMSDDVCGEHSPWRDERTERGLKGLWRRVRAGRR